MSYQHISQILILARQYSDEQLFAPSHQANAYFMKGDPEEEIPAFVKEEKVDVLVMGTVNDIITAGLYISSRAETILTATSSCSVLTVKPDGFVSPIQ